MAMSGLTLSETVSARTDVPPASDAAQDFASANRARSRLTGAGGRDWADHRLCPTRPPPSPPKASRARGDGRIQPEFSATDDYGVTAGQVTIALDLAAVDRRFGLAIDPEPREAVMLDLPMPITRRPHGFTETLMDDLSEHPFANLPVT